MNLNDVAILAIKLSEAHAELAEKDRLLKVALEAMETAAEHSCFGQNDEYGLRGCCGEQDFKHHADDCYLNNAIKQIKEAGK